MNLAPLIAPTIGTVGNGLLALYANKKSQEAMQSYRDALQADRSSALQNEEYLKNQDPLSTRTGRALSTDMGEKLKEMNDAAAGRNAVMGGGGHNTAATKDATSRLMGEYQRSLIRSHEMNIVPQLNYYRSRYDRANGALEKADYDKSVANAAAASQAAQGMIDSASELGKSLGNVFAGSGNGTVGGNVGTKTSAEIANAMSGGGGQGANSVSGYDPDLAALLKLQGGDMTAVPL